MATTPILNGEFIKIIDNDGSIRLPRTIAEAVQLPDGSSLQDYINAVNEDREVIELNSETIDSILDQIKKLQSDLDGKLNYVSKKDLELEVTTDNKILLHIGGTTKTILISDDVNFSVAPQNHRHTFDDIDGYLETDELFSDNLTTESNLLVGAINELDANLDNTITFMEATVYEDESTYDERLRRLENLMKKFIIYQSDDEENTEEVNKFYELMNREIEESNYPARIKRLEDLVEILAQWKIDNTPWHDGYIEVVEDDQDDDI